MGEKQETLQRVLAMYDIRGIQDYIFRTAKVKDAIGASAIVEDIIEEAMEDAVKKVKQEGETFTTDLIWYDENGVRDFHMEEAADIQVLYVGGGNAFFLFRDQILCEKINRHMSKYVIETTYSLQLAIAVTEYNGDYKKDYNLIFQKMNQIKETMIISRPLGALPVMDTDAKTGYPIVSSSEGKWISVQEEKVEETIKKKEREKDVRAEIAHAEKIFDNYVTKKGTDSTLAVVHIDGNNMGLRIREQIENIFDYDTAVNTMRRISYRINHSYKKVFYQMEYTFNQSNKPDRKYNVLKILTAGDDITYVCNGKLALKTVQYFAEEIAGYTMDGQITDRPGKEDTGYPYPVYKENADDKLKKYGFSVCAGIAYIHSHFPFYVGYETAEACCESAKKRAKEDRYRDRKNDRVGSWVDFQICKNIQAQNLDEVRQKEYVTANGEDLMLRPYFINTDTDYGMEKQVDCRNTLRQFIADIAYFQNEKNIPRSFAKELRNTYPQGKETVNVLYAFLKSRGWTLPDGTDNLYWKNTETEKIYARWYDALEMMDYYSDRAEEQTGGHNE